MPELYNQDYVKNLTNQQSGTVNPSGIPRTYTPPPSVTENTPPAGAEGFDPLGRPYFGSGLKGTLKRYYYNLMGSPTSGIGADNWTSIVDNFKKLSTDNSANENANLLQDIEKRTVKGLFGAESNVEKITDQDKNDLTTVNQQLAERKQAVTKEYSANKDLMKGTLDNALLNDPEYKTLSQQQVQLISRNAQKYAVADFGGNQVSLLSPFVRATQVGISALTDLFSVPAIAAEQAFGVNKELQNQEGAIKTKSDLVNFALQFTPVTAYNTANFLLSPTNKQEKADIVKQGWGEGRLFYSELFDESLKEEFQSRVKAGENPELVAMDIQNPWAELGGQLIFDPLNVVGFVEKAVKSGQVIDDAAKVVQKTGLADDARFLNDVEDLTKAGTDAEALNSVDKLTNTVVENFNSGVIKPQEYSLTALNASGNQQQGIRTMGNVLTWITSSIRKDGRGLDDVNDAITSLLKLSSQNPDEVKDGIVALTHFPSPMTYFNQSSLETSQMIRNLLKNEDGILDVDRLASKLKVENGNWKALGEKLKGLMDDAVSKQYPTVSEMKAAAENLGKAEQLGNKIPAKTRELAEQYKNIKKNNPGLIKLAELDEVVKKPVNAINRILGNFYFSLSPGFAFRNLVQNNLVMMIDAGPKAWFRNGQYLSDKFIGEELGKWFDGGLLPAGIDNYKTIGDEFNASDKILGIFPSGTALSSKIEESASKRVFYKFFRDSMEKMLQPGRALPSLEAFHSAGFTERQTKNFISMVQNNYGDIKKATKEFTAAYNSGGPDVWRMVESLLPTDAYKGLKDNGMMDEIIEFTRQEDVSVEDIKSFFNNMREEQKTRAMSIVDDPVGMQADSTHVKLRADIAAMSEKYTDKETQAFLDQLFERSTQTRDTYIKALQEIRDSTGDKELAKYLDSLMLREPDEAVRRVVQGITQNARDTIEKAKNGGDLRRLWNKLGTGTEFSGNSFKEFRSQVWEYTLKERIPKEWTAHYGAVFAESEKYAQKYNQTDLLAQARQMNAEAQDWRTAAYRGDDAYMTAPPYIPGSTPTFSRAHAETSEGALDALRILEEKMVSNYGIKAVDNFTPEMAKNLIYLTKDATNKVAEGRLISQKVGEYWRDFALLPYGQTTNLDHALSYIYPYQFWYSRSYSNWSKRLASDPQIIAAYAKFKDNMAALHKDSPEWWKYNATLPEFMWGLNNGNPMYVNLEATLWPLYGLTGTDFNDPRKRTNWFSATIDDLGKFGPSVWSPLNIAMAAGYAMKGEQDAAARWAGRVVPQTATLKAVMAELGQTPIELDPAVMAFSGNKPFDFNALDVYERNRVGRALAQMVTDKVISEEQAVEVARTQEGPVWDQAVTNATALRAPGQIASFFAGVGFKARTDEDVQIDNFYQEYYKMQSLHSEDMISDEQYKLQFNDLREKYPFMDTVLLSRKAGEDRNSAYAYNIISRIPPGSTNDVYDIIGIDPETAQKFYESGGSFEGWNEQEKDRFMTAMVDAGAILALPPNASRQEWTQAKFLYKDMQDEIKKEFGDNILEEINNYYELSSQEKEAYLEKFPQIEMAMMAQTAYISNTPLLSAYYGGLDITTKYYQNQMYSTLDGEFGDDISDKVDYYYYLKDQGMESDAKSFYNQEGLKAYFARKGELQQEANISIANAASNIPDKQGVLSYGDPQNPTQQELYNFANQPSQESQIAQQAWGELSPSMQTLVQDYFNGEELDYSLQKRLDYLSRDYNISREQLLRILGTELSR